MELHQTLSDKQFEEDFRTARLKPEVFSHEAHLRLAWVHIKQYGLEKAVENVAGQLTVYVRSLGAEDKFNKTLTVAAIKMVHHFMEKSESDTFADFITEFPRLKYNFKELLAFHYETDLFNSELARKAYLEPDLLPF